MVLNEEQQSKGKRIGTPDKAGQEEYARLE